VGNYGHWRKGTAGSDSRTTVKKEKLHIPTSNEGTPAKGRKIGTGSVHGNRNEKEKGTKQKLKGKKKSYLLSADKKGGPHALSAAWGGEGTGLKCDGTENEKFDGKLETTLHRLGKEGTGVSVPGHGVALLKKGRDWQ